MDTEIDPPPAVAGEEIPWLKRLGPGIITGAADDDRLAALVMAAAAIAMLAFGV